MTEERPQSAPLASNEQDIRQRHTLVEQSSDPVKTSGQMAYLSHLDRGDLMQMLERLRTERDELRGQLEAAEQHVKILQGQIASFAPARETGAPPTDGPEVWLYNRRLRAYFHIDGTPHSRRAEKTEARPSLLQRLRAFRGREWETTECYNGLREEAAAEIERLRGALEPFTHEDFDQGDQAHAAAVLTGSQVKTEPRPSFDANGSEV